MLISEWLSAVQAISLIRRLDVSFTGSPPAIVNDAVVNQSNDVWEA